MVIFSPLGVAVLLHYLLYGSDNLDANSANKLYLFLVRSNASVCHILTTVITILLHNY